MKKYLLGGKRVLCGILTAALIMTGINVPELSVKAATENSNNADQSEIKTEIASEMNSEESTETALQDSTTLEESSTTENSSEESETEKAKSTEETTEETTEKNSDEKTTDEEKSDEEASTEEKSDEEKSDEEASTEEKSDEEKSDKENPVDNDSEEQNNTDGTLQNGDFESGNWTYEPWEITVGEGNTLKVEGDDTNRYLNIWMNSEADVLIKQTVTNVKGGSYKCSLKQLGKFNNELSLKVKKDNEELASKSLGALDEWNNWQNIVTDEFKVAEGDTIVVEISGKLPADEGIKLDDILLQVSSDTFTKAQLEELYNKYKDYKETDYTAESWTAFKTALDAAKEIIDSSENDEDKITTAYKALQDAAGKLEQQGISFKLHFYADNLADDDQLGVFLWEKANIKFSDTTAKAEWKVWDKDCFLMTKSKYTGWCSIDIVVPSENAENGFEIYKASKNENGEYTTEKLYAISQSWDGKDIYAELVSKEAKEYALKNNKIYKDTDAEAVQRNVTLYVYDSEGTPAIISGKNKLKSVDMETGNIKALEHSYMDEWNNLYYDMTADEKAKGWYYLTLSVPSAGDNEKAFELYRKDGTGKYTWIKNFINGSNTDDYSVDINPVFAGNVYYKNGEFLNNQGISSEMAELKKLIAEAEKLDKKDYTVDSWNAFAKALNEAKAIAEKEDSATDEEIKTVKDKLENAKKGLKYSRQADINVEKIPLADDFITG
ncbi:MAG: FIVAR domain-containing protein, partial [Lachnospiraceae bacterium]|nr:FIVAR domain-containing protein [Lachnospiraceae bacterium]